MNYQMARRIERLPMTKTLWAWLFLAAMAWLIESYDIGLMGAVLVPLKTIWHLNGSEVGLMVASATVGIALGVVPAGFLADRFGRKRVLVWSLLYYSVATAATAFASNWTWFLVGRFVTGLGLGAMFPIPYTLLAELSPGQSRGKAAAVLDGFLSIGYFAAPLAASLVFPEFGPTLGWRTLFLIGSVGLLYAGILAKYLPESPRWLASQGRFKEADRIVQRLESTVPVEVQGSDFQTREDPKTTMPEKSDGIFSRALAIRTIMLWISFPAIFFIFYAVMNFMPLILIKEHVAPQEIYLLTAVMMGSSIPGKWLVAWLVERVGRKPVIVGFTAMAAMAAASFPEIHTPTGLLVLGVVIAFFGISVDPAMKIFTAEQYPTALRARGVAFTEGVGRLLGGALAPYIMALMLAYGGISGSFYFVAGFALVGSGTVLFLGQETSRTMLEESFLAAPKLSRPSRPVSEEGGVL